MRTLMKHWLVPMASLTLGVLANDASAQAASPALELEVYTADAASFNVNAVLVSGANEAVLVDTGFTRADAHRIAAMLLDNKKRLTTIYISQADPDFYFGAEVLKQVFPDAKLVASAADGEEDRSHAGRPSWPCGARAWAPTRRSSRRCPR